MEKELLKELKKILSGRTVTDADGWIMAVSGKVRCTFYGITNLCCGLTSQKVTVQAANDPQTALKKLSSVFQAYGTMVLLQNAENVLACLDRKEWGKSILLTAENAEDGKVVLTAYCARSCFSKICCRKALKNIKNAMK